MSLRETRTQPAQSSHAGGVVRAWRIAWGAGKRAGGAVVMMTSSRGARGRLLHLLRLAQPRSAPRPGRCVGARVDTTSGTSGGAALILAGRARGDRRLAASLLCAQTRGAAGAVERCGLRRAWVHRGRLPPARLPLRARESEDERRGSHRAAGVAPARGATNAVLGTCALRGCAMGGGQQVKERRAPRALLVVCCWREPAREAAHTQTAGRWRHTRAHTQRAAGR